MNFLYLLIPFLGELSQSSPNAWINLRRLSCLAVCRLLLPIKAIFEIFLVQLNLQRNILFTTLASFSFLRLSPTVSSDSYSFSSSKRNSSSSPLRVVPCSDSSSLLLKTVVKSLAIIWVGWGTRGVFFVVVGARFFGGNGICRRTC